MAILTSRAHGSQRKRLDMDATLPASCGVVLADGRLVMVFYAEHRRFRLAFDSAETARVLETFTAFGRGEGKES